jgi:hypothetical protein
VHFREGISAIKIVQMQESLCVMTSSNDGFLKVCTAITGDLICSMNIFNPLPIKWELPYTKQRKRQILLKRSLLDLQEMNLKYRGSTFEYQANKSMMGNKTMFLTEAFNLGVMRDKYKGVDDVMKSATEKYKDILQSEVSTKVTLRQLQYRQNRQIDEAAQEQSKDDTFLKK